MNTYTVYMVNFDVEKGTFDTANEAIEYAKNLGFECLIWVNSPGKSPLNFCRVNPY